MPASRDPEVHIPEVLPPEPPAGERTSERAQRAFGPIIGGAIIDAVDFMTWGVPGLVLGAAAAFWVCSIFKLPWWQRVAWALAAGYYCAVPFTRFIPLATLIGAYAQFREGARPSSGGR